VRCPRKNHALMDEDDMLQKIVDTPDDGIDELVRAKASPSECNV
jgi:hypothetical protein